MSRFYVSISNTELFKILYSGSIINERDQDNPDLNALITKEMYTNPLIGQLYTYFFGNYFLDDAYPEDGEVYVEISFDSTESINISGKAYRDIEVLHNNAFLVADELFEGSDMVAIRRIMDTDIVNVWRIHEGQPVKVDIKSLSSKIKLLKEIIDEVDTLRNTTMYDKIVYKNFNRKVTTDRIEASSLLICNTEKIVKELDNLFTVINSFDKNMYKIKSMYPLERAYIRVPKLREALLYNGFYFKYNAGYNCTDTINKVVSLFYKMNELIKQ